MTANYFKTLLKLLFPILFNAKYLHDPLFHLFKTAN